MNFVVRMRLFAIPGRFCGSAFVSCQYAHCGGLVSANERGTASAIFNSAQYFATVLFAPMMGWITVSLGWPYVFYFMGLLGAVVSAIWLKVIYAPNQHPRIG